MENEIRRWVWFFSLLNNEIISIHQEINDREKESKDVVREDEKWE